AEHGAVHAVLLDPVAAAEPLAGGAAHGNVGVERMRRRGRQQRGEQGEQKQEWASHGHAKLGAGGAPVNPNSGCWLNRSGTPRANFAARALGGSWRRRVASARGRRRGIGGESAKQRGA